MNVECVEQPNRPLNWVITVISRGGAARGESSTKQKAYIKLVHNVNFKSKTSRSSQPITFSDEDFICIQTPYDDPIMALVVMPI